MRRRELENDKIHYGSDCSGTHISHGTAGGGWGRMKKRITEVIDSRHMSGMGRIEAQIDKILYGSDRFGTYFRHVTDGGPE